MLKEHVAALASMINTTCPICLDDKTNLNPIVYKVKTDSDDIYQVRKCQKCSHTYTYFNHEVDIARYYDEKDYTVQDTKESIFFKIQKAEYGIVIRKIKKLQPLPDSLLDFGSGKGLFLQFAKEQGFTVKGIESSQPRANYAKTHYNLDINTAYYVSGTPFNQQFNVLTLFHVLEHIHLSDDLLNNLIKDNLKVGGLLVIEVPNFESWQSKWAGSRWLHLDVPRHISHFTPSILENLISQCGCDVETQSSFSFHLGIVGMVQTIFSWFGYKGFLIADLKRKKTVPLMISLALALPLAVALEVIASIFNKGGVIRFYARKNNTA